MTVKADLIFEEYIGVDLHEKLLLVNESNAYANNKRTKEQPQFFAPPEEVCVVEDDNAATNQTLAQEPPDLIESKRESSLMPSFNLLDEELGEGEPAAGTEKDDCEITIGHTIFDHIREKAKSFPLLTPSNSAYPPTSGGLILTRKRSRDQPLEEMERSKTHQHIVLDPSPESREPEQNVHGINSYMTRKYHINSGSSVTIDLTDESGDLPSEPEVLSFKTLTEETIFDHIRKKSRNFPVLNTLNPNESDSFFRTDEYFAVNQRWFCNATSRTSNDSNSSNVVRDAMVISELEPGEVNIDVCETKAGTKAKNNVFHGSSSGANGKSAVSPKVSSTNAGISSIKMLTFDISMVKNSKRLADLGSCIEDGSKELRSPIESKRPCCSVASTGKVSEVDSFLGFQSVFSFL